MSDTPQRPTRRYDYIDDGAAIYVESFATIRRESELRGIPADAEKVAVRMIHGTGQTDLAKDLVIHPGERVGIVGLNGHGKTTLFYAIAGLTGWQRGSIILNGNQIGRTRSQGPGRYTHQIVRQGLVIVPQGTEIFTGFTLRDTSIPCASKTMSNAAAST